MNHYEINTDRMCRNSFWRGFAEHIRKAELVNEITVCDECGKEGNELVDYYGLKVCPACREIMRKNNRINTEDEIEEDLRIIRGQRDEIT